MQTNTEASKTIRLALVMLAALASFACAAKQEGPSKLRKVTVVYPNKSGSQWPLYLAKEGGYYEKNGLDVTVTFSAHPASVAMLASNEAQLVNSSLEQMMQAASKGSTMILVGSSLNRGTFALIANKNIKDVAGLKKKKIAVGQIGDAPYGYVIAILSKAGLTARDVEWIPTGKDVSARAAALEGGRADATILTAPAYFKMEAAGYNILANLAERDDIFASTAFLMNKSDVADPQLAEALLKSHALAIQRFYNDKPFAVQTYIKYDAQPQADIERVYDLYAKPQAFERIPYVLAPAVKSVIDQQSDPQLAEQMKAFDFKTVIDNSIVDRLVKDNFFIQVFGESIKAEQERKAALAFGK